MAGVLQTPGNKTTPDDEDELLILQPTVYRTAKNQTPPFIHRTETPSLRAHSISSSESEAGNASSKTAFPSAIPGPKIQKTRDRRIEYLWTRAEDKLRLDSDKAKSLDAYYKILQEEIKGDGSLSAEDVADLFLTKIEELQAARNDSRWIHKTKTSFKKSMRRILEVQSIIGAAAGQCLPAAAACAGIAVILTSCVHAAEGREAFFDGMSKTAGAVHRITKFADVLWPEDHDPDEEVKLSLINTCATILDFHARAALYLKKSRPHNIISDAFRECGWDKLLSDVNENEEIVRKYADIRNLEMMIEVRKEQLKQEDHTHEFERQRQVEELMKRLAPDRTFHTDMKDRNRERVKGTCDWFTKQPEFVSINTQAASSSTLLFVTADPGCGKSVLARYLIDEMLPAEGRLVCYFFFKDDFNNQKSACSALCSLLYQIYSSKADSITEEVLMTCLRDKKFNPKVSELWNLLLAAAEKYEILCVLDALDECHENDCEDLISRITKLFSSEEANKTKNNKLKFLLTSRPYERIERSLRRRLGDTMRTIHVQGEEGTASDEIAEEIKLVLDSRIKETEQAFQLTDSECELMRSQFEKIQNRTYLWITLLFDGLFSRAHALDKRAILEMTKQLPSTVDEAYERILNRTIDKHDTKKLLCLVLVAERPLWLSEMSLALAFKDHHESVDIVSNRAIPEERIRREIRNRCGLFVTFVADRVYLLHQTAREFLLRHEDCLHLQPERSPRVKASLHHTDSIADWFRWLYQRNLVTRTILHLLGLISASSLWNHNFSSNVNARGGFHEDEPRARSLNAGQSPHDEDKTPLFIWKGSVALEEAHALFADICLLAIMLPVPETQHPLLQYSASYWINHYQGSNLEYQEAKADEFAAICQPSEVQQNWIYASNFGNKDTKDASGAAICLASHLGLFTLVKSILTPKNGSQRKMDIVNKKSNFGITPLLFAVTRGHVAVVELLLATDEVWVNGRNQAGRTPLIIAAQAGNADIVDRLLASGKAEVNVRDKSNSSALAMAATWGHTAVVERLLRVDGIEVEPTEAEIPSPFALATQQGHVAIMKLLMESGKADVNGGNELGRPLLISTVRANYEDVLRLLLGDPRINVEIRDEEGRTALSWAVEMSDVAVTELLIASAGTNVEAQDAKGCTPLMHAVACGRQDQVEVLLSKGKAKIDIADFQGRTALDWAQTLGSEHLADLLRSASNSGE